MTDSYLAPPDLASARRRVSAAAAAHCRTVGTTETAEGAVLSLGRPVASRLRTRSAPGAAFDGAEIPITGSTACVVTDMVLWRWDDVSLSKLAESLAPDRALLFLEPTADLGWRRIVHRLTKYLWRLTIGHDFHRDVPAALRQSGLTVSTVDRFESGPFGVRSYVWGKAEHIRPATRTH